jgi:methylsterol monooxygenase
MPRRVADTLFRRDMVGPSVVNIVTTLTGLVLIEKVAFEFMLPPLVPSIEAWCKSSGTLPFMLVSGGVSSSVAFWGFGMLFAIPALLHVSKWKIQQRKTLDARELLRAMPLIVFNFMLSAVVIPVVLYACLPSSSFDWRTLPSTTTLARDALVWMTIEEVLFFYVHRWLHINKWMYQKVHKLHHTWTAPVSFVSIYCNPVEHILSNMMPLIAGPIICGSHIFAISVFIFLGLIHTQAVHSGYWICDDNGAHDEHHAKFNVNFGVTGIMDSWYGTYRLPSGAVNPRVAEEAGSRLCASVDKKSD